MKRYSQRGAKAGAHPLWLRVLATACLLLVGFAGTAEAVHIHGQWLPHYAAHVEKQAPASNLPGGEEKCPLCVGMHSILPATARVAPLTTVLVAVPVITTTDRLPQSIWHYASFSRPPPRTNS